MDDAKQESTLLDAGIERARLVVIASNSIETALIVTKRARDRNKKALIIVRCFLDEFTEILESLGANEVISSSKSAFTGISSHLDSVGQLSRNVGTTSIKSTLEDSGCASG